MHHPDTHTDSGDSRQQFSTEEQSFDQLMSQAVEAAAKGENIEQILEVMLVQFSSKEKERVRKAFAAALAKRGLRQPSGDPDIAPRNTLSRIRNALAVSTKQMIDRIMLLVRLKPDVAARIQQAGRMLAKNGVAVDKTPLSEAELGTLSPTAARATGRGQDRGGRGA
jgi:hypothetical protein